MIFGLGIQRAGDSFISPCYLLLKVELPAVKQTYTYYSFSINLLYCYQEHNVPMVFSSGTTSGNHTINPMSVCLYGISFRLAFFMA